MGMEFEVNNAEDLCAMMCDNIVPKEKESWWIFTFGSGQEHAGYFVKVKGTFSSSRKKMFEKYGDMWAFQYSLEEWGEWLRRKPVYVPEEKLLEVIK